MIQWKSTDGADVEGILMKPADYDPTRKYPLLVVIHGGPTGVDTAVASADRYYPIERFAAKGALVLKPNYRGSAGYGAKFRALNVRNLGLGDYWDVISGVDSLIAKGIVDKDRVASMGWSEGGYISAFITTYSDRFKAVSVGAGISDWVTYYVNTDIHPFTRQYLKATPWEDPEIYRKTSPITYVNRAKTPTLIQQGDQDKRVPPPDSYELYQALKDRGVPVEADFLQGLWPSHQQQAQTAARRDGTQLRVVQQIHLERVADRSPGTRRSPFVVCELLHSFRCATRRSRNPSWPFEIFWRAIASENHSPRSTSGNSCDRPDPRGHSIENRLLRIADASQSLSNAHAVTSFPLACRSCPRERNSPSGRIPVSSSNSRIAAASAPSLSGYSPFGIVHDSRSLFFQNGPPGCTSRTSIFSVVRRNISSPALVLATGHSTTKPITLKFQHVETSTAALACRPGAGASTDSADLAGRPESLRHRHRRALRSRRYRA